MALPTTAGEVPVLEDLGYLPQLRAFVADLDAGRPPVMDGRFGREVLQVVMAAYTSAGRAGRRSRCRSPGRATGPRWSSGGRADLRPPGPPGQAVRHWRTTRWWRTVRP
ncbi:MAG: hypothetical protein R2694_07915 [Ilumatobacteraceae bacterium]